MESLSYKNDRFEAGCSLYNQISSKLSSIIGDFDSIVSSASEVESCKAGFMYDGAFKDMVVNIGNGLNELTGLLEKNNGFINRAVNVLDDYSKGNISADIAISRLKESTYFRNYSLGSDFGQIKYKQIYDDEYTPQGMVVIGDMVVISAYKDDKNNSQLYFYDKGNPDAVEPVFVVDLNNTAHVGGVAFDSYNNVLFVCDENGHVSTYDYEKMLIAGKNSKVGWGDTSISHLKLADDKNKDIVLKSNININLEDKNKKSNYNASTVFFDNVTNKLYIAEYADNTEKAVSGVISSGVLSYDKENGTCSLVNQDSIKMDANVQGVSIYHKDNRVYLVETRSYGKKINTQVVVKDVTGGVRNDSPVVAATSISTPYGEAIQIDSDGNGVVLHENEHKIHRLGDNQGTSNFSIDRIIEGANNGEEEYLEVVEQYYKKNYGESFEQNNPEIKV